MFLFSHIIFLKQKMDDLKLFVS